MSLAQDHVEYSTRKRREEAIDFIFCGSYSQAKPQQLSQRIAMHIIRVQSMTRSDGAEIVQLSVV